MDDIFAGEVEDTQNEIQQQAGTDSIDVPEEFQEDYNHMQSLVSMHPEVVDSDEYKDLMAKIESHDSGQASDEESEEEGEEESEDETEEEEPEEEEESEEEEEEEGDEIEDVFGTIAKNSKKKAKKIDINFDVPEEMADLLSNRYGIKDASTFFGSVDTWRQQAQEGSESKNQLDSLINDIQAMPPDLRTAIQMWSSGEDHTAVFTEGLRLDFASGFEDQDIESLVEHYLPEQYDDLIKKLDNEDIEEEEFEDKITLLAKSTKKMFNGDKKAKFDQRADYDKKQADHVESVKKSANSSVESLSKSFPNFSKSELSRVRSYLVEGKVDSLIYNADGTYKAEAAEMVANMMYGGKMRETIEKLAMRRGESKANQRIVESSSKTVKKKKTSSTNKGSTPKAVQHLGGVVVDNDPYAQSMD